MHNNLSIFKPAYRASRTRFFINRVCRNFPKFSFLSFFLFFLFFSFFFLSSFLSPLVSTEPPFFGGRTTWRWDWAQHGLEEASGVARLGPLGRGTTRAGARRQICLAPPLGAVRGPGFCAGGLGRHRSALRWPDLALRWPALSDPLSSSLLQCPIGLHFLFC